MIETKQAQTGKVQKRKKTKTDRCTETTKNDRIHRTTTHENTQKQRKN